ncbi:MAG TPA: uroporphyrinogen-III C-methyltransferase [Gammaproteobacteria bacterium]|nr:uroporphyrinogen-III C-methyltransferase [Gammaproteobacteria bacterium]
MTEPTDKAPPPGLPSAEHPPVAADPVAARPPRRSAAVPVLIVALLLLTAAAVGGGYYFWERLQRLEARQQALATDSALQERTAQLAQADAEMRQSMQSLVQSSAATTESLVQLEQRLEGVSAAQENVQQRLAKLDVETQARQGEWIRAEAVYLARLAVVRASLQRDVGGALAALKLADDLLAQLNSRAINERQAIHRAINRLVEVDLPDVDKLAKRIEALITRIDVLPLAQQLDEVALSQQQAKAAEPAPTGWQARLERGWQRFKDTLGELVIVQRGRAVEPLIAPEERYFLYHNLRLRLESARLALLEGDVAIYQRSLNRAGEWIERYYAGGEPGVDSALAEIAALRAVNIRPELPPLAQLLEPVLGH